MRYFIYTLLPLFLVLNACEDLPDSDPGAREKATLVAMLEPGEMGIQEILLSKPVPLGQSVSDSSSFLSGAEVLIRNLDNGESGYLFEDALQYRYVFSRDTFPLTPGTRYELELSGSWAEREFSGSAITRIVSPENLAFTEKPLDPAIDYPADTLMYHDEDVENNFNNQTAFHVNWIAESPDEQTYQYQVEFLAVAEEDGLWGPLPADRMAWLRDDEDLAFQVGPYPDLRFPPGETASRIPISWGFFVFVDAGNEYTGPVGEPRNMGYYRITLRRMNQELAEFFYSTHWWIRADQSDPVLFNLDGNSLQGVLGSCATTSFRVAIVEE